MILDQHIDKQLRRGRGAITNQTSRYDLDRAPVDDGWDIPEVRPTPVRTRIERDRSRKIITRNNSPDIAFDRSINPYRGCEHGCIYCFARPTHAYLGLSPGLDFETRLFVKNGAAQLLEAELSKPGYEPKPIALGTSTDPYQPIDQRLEITRQLLEVLDRFNHPVVIVTKGATLIRRDIDILASMARRGLAQVAISVTTLDAGLSRMMEPRAAAPLKRLETITLLSEAGIPVSALMAPIIPALNDHEIEPLLERVANAGASQASYVLLRLPLEIKSLFREWLEENVPDRASRVMALVRSMRGGKDYDTRWFTRQIGSGPYADLIAQRFRLAKRRNGLADRDWDLNLDHFAVPPRPGDQLQLFS